MQFTPQLTPTWLDISVSVLHWLEGRGVCAQTTCSRRPIFMHIPAAEEDIQSRNHLQIQWQSLCAWGLSVCLSAACDISTTLQLSCSQSFPGETGTWAGICQDIYEAVHGASQHKWSVNLTDWQEGLYIWCYRGRMMKCCAWRWGDNWADGALTSGPLVAVGLFFLIGVTRTRPSMFIRVAEGGWSWSHLT